jgi:hypothetical protein
VGTWQARYGANQHDAVAEEIEWFVFSKHVLTTRRTNYKPATPIHCLCVIGQLKAD